jgi:hypothetical protein
MPFASLWSRNRLISLWQMITEYPTVQFWWLSHELLRLEYLLRKDEGEPGTVQVVTASPIGDFPAGLAADITAVISFAEIHCRTFEFQDTALLPLYNIKASLEKVRLLKANTPNPSADIARDLKSLRKTIEMELAKRRFVYVPPEKIRYFAQEKLFGQQVYDKFPSARHDLAQAGDCVACGLDSAASFHLMRAAEVALWELGRDRQIPSVVKIESMEWGSIIGELEEEIKKIQQWPNTNTFKEEAHRFYNRAVVEIRAFNDGWRRHIAHVRKSQIAMESDEAIALTGHVERFLKTLATKIAEGQYTALEW